MKRCFAYLIAIAAAGVVPSAVRAGYLIENIAYPAELRGGFLALTFTREGSLVVANRSGEIWIRQGDGAAGQAGSWRRFARGLDEPSGIIADSERDMYISH